jgi:hypothetical protein
MSIFRLYDCINMTMMVGGSVFWRHHANGQ